MMLYLIAFFFHILGDYILQPDDMALRKSKDTVICLTHVVIYSLPFLFITDLLWWSLLVFLTHFLIDRFRLVFYIIRTKNYFDKSEKYEAGFIKNYPLPMCFIVYVVIDNSLHLAMNFLAIYLSQ